MLAVALEPRWKKAHTCLAGERESEAERDKQTGAVAGKRGGGAAGEGCKASTATTYKARQTAVRFATANGTSQGRE
jgi:hypothetical protein